MRSVLAVLGLAVLAGSVQAADQPRLFLPPVRPALPAVKQVGWVKNPIDGFILARLESKGLSPSAAADRLRLLRRVTFDLTGLPPTINEQEAFLADPRSDAYLRVVERLLASPRFGERQAQHWLDLVRYADSDGFKEDALRHDAYRYRDWVIRALNANMGYDRFLAWQLAGDELAPEQPDALIAAGFNRLWPDEYNAANLEQRRQEILDDTTDTTAAVFLGLTFGCARCHDHKYDPISQKDYFRLQAFFAGMRKSDVPALDSAGMAAFHTKLQAWEQATSAIRAEMEQLIGALRDRLAKDSLTKFRAEIVEAVNTAPGKRTPYQQQIAQMALEQANRAGLAAQTKLSAEAKKRYQALEARLKQIGPRPEPPRAMSISDVGPLAPPTHRLMGGDWRKPAAEVKPAFPAVLGGGEVDTRLEPGIVSTGRRAALARWLTRQDHPLTARVLVNRLWQHHFGTGLVATPSDFGVQGTPPTHPELLDWLATEFVASGWDLKHMHRLMVTSATYVQDSSVDPTSIAHQRGLAVDPENDLLWHGRRRRLEGEAIRDALLALSGELDGRMFGPSARPALPAAFGKAAWKPDEDVRDQNRRSVYVLAKRNVRYPLFDAFDQPDLHNSCACRMRTTTAPQALLLLNSELTLERARVLSARVLAQEGITLEQAIQEVGRSAWGRRLDATELGLARQFLNRNLEQLRPGAVNQAFVDFCHAILNTNEFVYID